MESLHSRTWWDSPLVMENLHEIPHESNDLCSVRASMSRLKSSLTVEYNLDLSTVTLSWIPLLYPIRPLPYHIVTLSYHYPVTAILMDPTILSHMNRQYYRTYTNFD